MLRKLWYNVGILLLSGCTFYGTPVQIEDWPALKIVTHRVSSKEVRDACNKYSPWWASPQGCAVYYKTECHIWAMEGPMGDDVAAIELDNCLGKSRPYWRERLIEIRDQIKALK